MTVSTTTRRQFFTLDGSTPAFTFTFRALTSAPSDIKAKATVSGTTTTLAYTTQYTVTVNADGIGGTVTLVSPSTVGSGTLTVYRDTTNTQGSDYDDFNQFPADTLEGDLDIRTVVAQEQAETLARGFAFDIAYSGTASTIMPTPVADDVLGWNSIGSALENKVGLSSSVAAAAASAAAASVSAASSSSYATTASTQATASASSATVAASLASSASASATSATNAATTASTIAVSLTATLASLTFPAGAIVGTTDTQTLTNKRITNRVSTTTTATAGTIASDSFDCYELTALGSAFTFNVPSGTPTNFQKLIVRIKDDGGARALTWSSSAGGFVAGGVALPSTTVISKILTLGFLYNTANSLNKWQLVASAQEA